MTFSRCRFWGKRSILGSGRQGGYVPDNSVERHDAWALPDRGHYESAGKNLADVGRHLDGNRLDRGARDRLIEDLNQLRRLREDWHFDRG